MISMKVCKTDVNKISLHSIILQLQLTLELSQFKEILSVYSDLLVLVANYSFIFENSSSEIQALKENPVSVETALISQDPIRDGRNWYAYCGGDPINYTDPNGLTTIVNEADGHVLDVQRDGDTSILAYPYTPDGQRCEGPAQYYGKTMYEDSFISPDTGKPVGVIYPNQSIDQKMAELSISAGEMGYTKTWYESRSGGKLDIKAQMPGHEGKSYHGFKYNGYVISLREAGNILAGQNAAYYNMSYEDFQKGAGALQQKGLVGAAKYKIFGTIYGPAPYYGENEYQYRCSLTGYNQTMTGIFSPVNIFSFSIKGK